MIRFLLASISMSLCLSAAAAERQLEISGFTDKTKEKIFQKIPSLKDGSWTAADLDQLIQILVYEEQYDSAQIIRDSDTRYRVTVGRIRRIASLSFQGNSGVSESELRRELGISEKMPFDPGLLVEAGERIRKLYETLGYPKAQVDLQYVDSQKTEVAISINIREGPRTIIDEVKIITPNPELNSLMTKLMKKFRGEPLMERTLVDLRSRAREILSRNGFWRTDLPEPKIMTNIDESKAEMTFQFDRSDQYFFEPEGNRRLSKSEMTDYLQMNSYYSANPNIAGELGSKVRLLYLSQGFARAEVEADEIEGSRQYTKRIRLKIEEGPRIKIEKIEFSGLFSRSSKDYVEILKDYSSPVIRDDYYVKEDLDQGLKNMITDRWNQGYLRAKIVSTRTIYNKERDRITILVNFEEGPLTQVQRITFEGNQSISEVQLTNVLGLEAGKPLRLNQLDEAILKLKQHYRDLGFLEMNLINEKEGLVTYNEDNTLVHLNFKISEGPQVRVNSIVIEGNSITRDEVILKELEFTNGDILSPQKIEESTSRLQRLGHFNSVEIRTLEEKTKIADRTVIVKVADRDPGLFNFGIGANNDRGLTTRGFIGLAYRNLWGTGRGISARFDTNYNVSDVKYLERKITVGYLEPYIFDTRIRGRINLTRAISVSDFDKREASELNQTTYSLEQDITSHLLVRWDVWSLATVRDFFIDGNREISQMNIASTALTADWDFRDHPFNPTKGTFTRLNAEYGSPALGSTNTIEYGRSYGSFTHYQPMFKRAGWVWANSVRGGYLKNLSTDRDGAVPYDKKGFLLGGQSTIRGFTPDEAFPNNKLDFGNVDRLNLKGSATMTSFKSELRFPLYGNIGGAVFYDGGEVRIYNQDFTTGQTYQPMWRDSVGIAARYITPVGAVSLEYGWKLKARGDRNEDPAVFHFSIGTF